MLTTISLSVALMVGTMAEHGRLLLQTQGQNPGAGIVNPVNFGSVPANNPPAGQGSNVVGTIPSVPTFKAPLPPTTELKCEIPQGLPGSCAGNTQTPENLGNNFKLYCTIPNGCKGGTFNLFYGKYGQTTPVAGAPRAVEGIWFTEVNAGAYATINLYNFYPGNSMEINRIECDADFSCMNLQINTYNVDIGDFVCEPEAACTGCTVTDWTNPAAPVSTPCIQLA